MRISELIGGEGRKRISLTVAGLSAVSFVFWGVLWTYFPKLAQENYIVENIQALCLLVGFLIYLFLCIKSSPGNYSILFIGLSLFYLTFCVRELELTETHTWFAVVINPPVRNHWLSIAWAVSILIFVRHFRGTLHAFVDWVKETQGVLLIFGGMFYLAGDLFDKNVFSLGRAESLFYEELLEFNAATLMVVSAVYSVMWAKKQMWWYA